MGAVYRKELGHFFNNPLGYIVVILFALFGNFLFIKDIFAIGSASMQPFFTTTAWLFVIFVPALSMRSIAEERRSGTLETLLTLPIDERDIVLGKFMAILTVVGIGLVLTMALPVSLGLVAHLYIPEVLVGYIGLMLLASSLIAISMYFSARTSNQIVAFFTSAIVLFVVIAFSSDFVAAVIPRSIADYGSLYAPMLQVGPYLQGVIDVRGLVYFATLTGLFIYFTTRALRVRK